MFHTIGAGRDFSLKTLGYDGGLLVCVSVPFLPTLVYRNKKALDLGDVFTESYLASNRSKSIQFSTTLITTHFSLKWNKKKTGFTLDIADLLLGSSRHVVFPDPNVATHSQWTASNGQSFMLTWGSLYEVRSRWPFKKKVKEGWIATPTEEENNPLFTTMVFKSPQHIEEIVRLMDGLSDSIRQSREYFDVKDGK